MNDFLMNKKGILSKDSIDSSDSVYKAWTKEESISLKEFLTYAAGKNWIDISQFSSEDEYLDSNEVYTALADYLTESWLMMRDFPKSCINICCMKTPSPVPSFVCSCTTRMFWKKMMPHIRL